MKSSSLIKFSSLLFLILNVFPLFSQEGDSPKLSISRFEKVSTDASVYKTFIDEKNILWLASNKGLIETNGDGSRFEIHFPSTEIKDVVSDRRDNIWAASNDAIYNQKTKQSYNFPVSGLIISDITYLDGSVWIATNNGLYQFIATTGRFKSYDTKNSNLASNVINFVHADRNKILWIGTDKGYVRVENDYWELQDKKFKMLATAENQEGQWIISDQDMFLLNSFNRLFPVKLDPSQYKGKINDFVLDSKGRIYIASDILVRYDPYNEKIENYSNDAATLSKACLSLGCDKNDNIWIGTDQSGFYKLLFGDIAKEQLNASLIVESNILCLGNKNGSLKVSVSGGHRPFTYDWNRSSLSGSSVSGLSAGKYQVTVTDKLQNKTTASVELSSPEEIKVDLVSNNRVTNPENPDGSVFLDVSGGAGGFSYAWSNGQTGQNLVKATSGTYSVNVKDKNNCIITSTYIVKREKFIPDLEMSKISIGQKLRINELNFDSDSSTITQANYDVLEEVYEFLSANNSLIVEIGGHTNTIPPHEYCDKLSTDRAKNVAMFLYDRGIDASRVSFKGYGKREPLTESTSIQGRQRNQRVEIKIIQI